MTNKFILVLISISISYLLAEFTYSYLHINHLINQKTIWFHEATDPGNNLIFNPNIGYVISRTPSRFGAVTSTGTLESIGIMEGNNLGFPDNNDFFPENGDSTIKRIAVLGDSFTASQFTNQSWVDLIEKMLNEKYEDSVVLMNFSVDGGGLGNWSSIIENIIIKDSFELDGIIFAILGDDLDREFMWKNDYVLEDKSVKIAVGKNQTWLPENNPDYSDTLNPFFLENYLILKKEEIDKIEKGLWKENRPVRAYLTDELIDILRDMLYNLTTISIVPLAYSSNAHFFQDDQYLLIERLSKNLSQLNIPAITFSFLTDHEKSKHFSNTINSEFIDDQNFQNWTSNNPNTKIQIEGDGHWNNTGTVAFAKSSFEDLDSILRKVNIIND